MIERGSPVTGAGRGGSDPLSLIRWAPLLVALLWLSLLRWSCLSEGYTSPEGAATSLLIAITVTGLLRGAAIRGASVSRITCLLLAVAWLVFGVRYRGSSRWLQIPFVGRVPVSEIAVGLVCVLATERRPSRANALGMCACLVAWLAFMGCKSYACMASLVVLYATRGWRSAGRVVAWSVALLLGGVALLAWTTAGERLRGFLDGSGASLYTETRLASIRQDIGWGNPSAHHGFPWQQRFVFDDFTVLWDGWHLGLATTVMMYGLVCAAFLYLTRGEALRHQPAVKCYLGFVLVKFVAHLLSCLGWVPVIGISAPLVTGSVTEYCGLAIVLGSAAACTASEESLRLPLVVEGNV